MTGMCDQSTSPSRRVAAGDLGDCAVAVHDEDVAQRIVGHVKREDLQRDGEALPVWLGDEAPESFRTVIATDRLSGSQVDHGEMDRLSANPRCGGDQHERIVAAESE